MKTKFTYCFSLVFLLIFESPILADVNPQNPLFSMPPYYINFNSGIPSGINLMPGFGAITADFSHNIQYTVDGDILFSVVDGAIFDGAGNVIDYIHLGTNPNKFLTGITEFLIVPVPGNCKQYYLIAGAYTVNNTGNTGGFPLPFSIKLDMSSPAFGQLYNSAGIATNNADPLAQYSNLDQHAGSLHLSVSPLRYTNDRLLFLANTADLYCYKITSTGITYQSKYGYGGVFQSNGSGNTRSEMEVYSYPTAQPISNGAPPLGYTVAFPFESTAGVVNGQFVDSRILVADLVVQGNVINTPRIINFYTPNTISNSPKGIEFSPDGNKLYISHELSPYLSYADLSSSGTTINLQGLNFNNAVDFKNSQIELAYDGKMYLSSGDRLASISSPNNNPIWNDQVANLNNISPPIPLSYGGLNIGSRAINLLIDQIDGEIYWNQISPSSIINNPGSLPQVACSGNTISVSANSGYSSYLWSTGATTQTINLSSSGTFTVAVMNSAGCIGKSDITTNIIACCNGNYTLTGNFYASQLLNQSAPYITTNPPGMTSGFIPMNGSTPKVAINGTLIIDVPFTLHDLELVMGEKSKIVIQSLNPNVSLTLSNNNYLHGCSNMWQGIELGINNKQLIADGTGETWIEDAETAIVSLSDGRLDLQKIHFNRNWKGIALSHSANSISIYNCTFSCYSIMPGTSNNCIAPHAGLKSFDGIEISDGFPVTIGNNSQSPNTFDDLMNGIIVNEAGATIRNCKFSNILKRSGYESGKAIYAKSRNSVNHLSVNQWIGQTSTNPTFIKCDVGVYTDEINANITG